MSKKERSPELRSAYAIANQRTVPTLYVVDETTRVVLSSDGRDSLPEDVRNCVKEMIRRHTPDEESRSVPLRLLDSWYVVRVTALSGDLGRLLAVYVERFQARDQLRVASLRFMLTKRESEVLALLIDGSRTSEIADRLSIAQSTVLLHIKSAMAKTSAHTRTEMLGRIMAVDGTIPSPS